MLNLLTLTAILLAPAAQSDMREGPGHSSGPAHPSAFLCRKLGGVDLFATAPGGTISQCRLHEAKISPMTLWFAMYHREELATKTYLAHPQPREGLRNAADYCRSVGGEIETLVSYDGKLRSDECVFSEGGHLSSIDLVTLFRGPAHPGNAWLTRLLSGK